MNEATERAFHPHIMGRKRNFASNVEPSVFLLCLGAATMEASQVPQHVLQDKDSNVWEL